MRAQATCRIKTAKPAQVRSLCSQLYIIMIMFLAVIVLLFLSGVSAKPTKQRSEDWDYFMFVQENPAGFCLTKAVGGCDYPQNVTDWIMHGLWPTKAGTIGPSFCDPSATFDPSALDGFLPQMVEKWANLETDTNFYSFWQHEWLKHGTCVSGIPAMSDEKGFFWTVLGIYDKFGFSDILAKNGVKPSNSTTIPLERFTAAFQNSVGVKPYLQCMHSKELGSVIVQMSICLDKDYSTPIDCSESSKTSCAEDVFYAQSMWGQRS